MMPGPFGRSQNAAQPEDHAALVLAKNLDGVEQIENDDGDKNQRWNGQIRTLTFRFPHSARIVLRSSNFSAIYAADSGVAPRASGATCSSICSWPTTRRLAPLGTGVAGHRAPDLALHQHMPLGSERLHGDCLAAHHRIGADQRLASPRAHGQPHQKDGDPAKRRADRKWPPRA